MFNKLQFFSLPHHLKSDAAYNAKCTTAVGQNTQTQTATKDTDFVQNVKASISHKIQTAG